MPFLNGEKLHSEIINTLKSKCAKCCAVAFVGKGAASLIKGKTRIVCNLFSSGTNPYEVKKLMSMPNVSIRHLDNLHTKIYLTDDYVIHGSANMTDHALNFFKTGNNLIECADKVIMDKRPVLYNSIKNFTESLWGKGVDVNEKMIQKAIKNFNTPQRELCFNDCDICDSAVPYYVLVYNNDELGDEALTTAENNLGKDWEKKRICVWENWDELPCGYLIDLFMNSKGTLNFYGLSEYHGYRIPFIYEEDNSSGVINISKKIRCSGGFKQFVKEKIIPLVSKKLKTKELIFDEEEGGSIWSVNEILD